MTQIRLDGITKIYDSSQGPVTAVADASLAVQSGELFFLLGPSGCGKTTLLRIIAGLTEPTAGRIWFGDRDVTGLPCEKRNTAMVFQSYALWPHMTVRQNVEFGPKMRGLPRGRRRELARDNLTLVEMQDFERRKPNQLSGGQQQRVAVARALAAGPDCPLLDEPLSNLDARLRTRMRTELRGLVKAAGTTGIYVTHDQKEALSMADRVAVMNAGRVVQIDTPQQLYDRPADRFVADFLGEANFIDGRIAGRIAGHVAGSAADVGQPMRIDTPAGPLAAESAAGFDAGQAVLCCIRPERIAISPAAATAEPSDADATALPATVQSRIYLGETHQYHCRLADGTDWKVFVLSAGGEALGAGAAVRLTVRPRDVILLRE